MPNKQHTKKFFIMLLICSTTLGGIGQFLFKEGLLQSPVYLVVLLLLGLLAYAISTIAYFYALGRSHLSWAYSFGGISYVAASLLAAFVLGEAISPIRWLGILVIAIGTAIIGSS